VKIFIQHFSRNDTGGGFVNLLTLVNTLIKNYPKDQFVILCSESSMLSSTGQNSNVEIVHIPPSRLIEYRRLHLLLRAMPQLVADHRPDVVWSFNFGPYVATGVPQVLSVFNAFQVYPSNVATYHPRNALHAAFIRWFSRRSLKASDAAIVETSLMGEYVRKIFGAPSRILVAPKAVGPLEEAQVTHLPKDYAQALNTGPGKDMFTFLYMAHPSRHKNHKVVVAAAKALRASSVRARLALTITEKDVLTLTGEDTRSLIREGRVVPLGYVPIEHVHAVYKACDACVMPSLLESLSSSHLEAMQWGRPQICADLPYARELCGPAATYANPTDPAHWAAAMQIMTESPTLRNSLTEAGHKQMKKFPKTWREVGANIHHFLEELVEALGRKKR
jgi:glycosyltransferase involved in cell wall biosynthesis